jgi:hypothetical protein
LDSVIYLTNRRTTTISFSDNDRFTPEAARQLCWNVSLRHIEQALTVARAHTEMKDELSPTTAKRLSSRSLSMVFDLSTKLDLWDEDGIKEEIKQTSIRPRPRPA